MQCVTGNINNILIWPFFFLIIAVIYVSMSTDRDVLITWNALFFYCHVNFHLKRNRYGVFSFSLFFTTYIYIFFPLYIKAEKRKGKERRRTWFEMSKTIIRSTNKKWTDQMLRRGNAWLAWEVWALHAFALSINIFLLFYYHINMWIKGVLNILCLLGSLITSLKVAFTLPFVIRQKYYPIRPNKLLLFQL